MSDKLWCIEFWDFGAWNEYGGTRRKHKDECIKMAQQMNKRLTHEGHRDSE
jgi:hypothetical protein